MSNKKPLRIQELSGWRGIFILMIFFHHVDLFPAGGTMGVAFFFLLGGFAMTLGYSEKVLESSFRYGAYLTKRASRFYPIHWVVLFLFCILNYLCSVPIGITTFVPNFILLQSFIPDRAVYYAYNSPSWYLCNTLFFAALFPFIIKVLNKWREHLWFKILAGLLVAIYVIVLIFTPENWRHAILYINPFVRLMDYMVGILAGLWLVSYYKKENEVPPPLLYTGIICSLVLLSLVVILPSQVRMFSVIFWVPELGIIICTSLLSRVGRVWFLRSKFLVSFGEVSFAFYMLHSLCINIVQVALFKFGTENQFMYVCCSLLLTITLSYLATYYFITPISKCLTSKLSK